ncbi:glycogen/starch/alpha-glucan phosphorylase [Desulfurivibrio sp. D14AmB]|uniref:glycogen/starch/alpha-glucan phosphorylase n=1 Tax=Desulfurivibrio sp. D14AmB TaxID=3374370 RepID=UPI00376ECADA
MPSKERDIPLRDHPAPTGPYCSFGGSLGDDDLLKTIHHHLLSFLGRDPMRAGNREIYKALAYTVRDFLIERWVKTQKDFYAHNRKRVYYLSLEFLIGRSLGNSLINLGLYDKVAGVLEQMGYDLDEVREEEEDAALGNGGLGRLAACFMDSMATLGIPAYGYGIRYEYGLFYQRLLDGFQVEHPDNWLRYGTPWEYDRPWNLYPVKFHGRVHRYHDAEGKLRHEWVDTSEVMAMANDILVPGFRNDSVINMRLWSAKASRELDLISFNRGDYVAAVQSVVESETISKVLYPSDDIREGQELRFKQQYFFVAATFQDILRRYKKQHGTDFGRFTAEIAVQLNDTHPAIAIPELMRLLLDEEGMTWEDAWGICVQTFGYTNHTLMPEALETWAVDLFHRVLPRHLEIVYEINRRFLEEVAALYPGDEERLRRMSMIDEGPVKKVRMAHLAIVGSHSTNGVAKLHTHLQKTRIFNEFYEIYPQRFNNKTNGVTQRRWLLKSNPGLAALITESIGGDWVTKLEFLRNLESLAGNRSFQRRWLAVKRQNKQRLAALIKSDCGVAVDPDSLFDVQVKRMHEYKRQLLNILHIIIHYQRLVRGERQEAPARTVVFAGKAAPSYAQAKLIIKLINSVGETINRDPRVADRLKVIFIPNYGVSLAEKIIPAADLSEQISTAGTEASGTGNMKFALNGALTIGTMDGANVEMCDEIGRENMFIFGMDADQVEAVRRDPLRTPETVYQNNQEVRAAVDAITAGEFSRGDTALFTPIVRALLSPDDPYLFLLDLEDYLRCQEEVDREFLNRTGWARKSILNVARMGKFSTDRTIREYAEEIWGIKV